SVSISRSPTTAATVLRLSPNPSRRRPLPFPSLPRPRSDPRSLLARDLDLAAWHGHGHGSGQIHPLPCSVPSTPGGHSPLCHLPPFFLPRQLTRSLPRGSRVLGAAAPPLPAWLR
uniref:PI-PLC Y-box domain-containing protein n=3 Tax=Aegilops tauschii subsp. strangulata TaxID=200361 RepID=A0A452ZK02_AEGTS